MSPQVQDRRVAHEQEFHDRWADSIKVDELLVKEAFESPTAIENRYALSQLGNLQGKKILDLGCGAGEAAVYFATQGAESFACDISSGMVEVGLALAKKHGVRVHFSVVDAAHLPYPDGFFDLVFGNGVLHHVDHLACAKEVRRILKDEGKAAFVEPLPYNPVIGLYRKLAKEVRTDYEKPLSFSDVERMRPLFSSFHHKEFWLASLLIFGHFYLVRRWNPSKVRYWKKVIEAGYEYEDFFGRLQKLDEFLLRYFPFLRGLCWNSVIVAGKA